MNPNPIANTKNAEMEWQTPQAAASSAAIDIVSGFAKSWLWMTLALQDIKLRYRGSVLGPFWLTITTVVMVASMGVIYSTLFHQDIKEYLPYLTIGLILWGFVAGTVSEGCMTFLSAEGIIQSVPMPFSVHAYRSVFRNLIVLAHSIVIIPVGMLIFEIPFTWRILEILPAFLFYAINGVWISILFGMSSARFRDIPPIVANFTQVLFFLTPIIYPVSSLGNWKAIATLNPAFAVIDVVRAPLMGVATDPYSWPMLLATTIVGCIGTFYAFAHFRARIAYWI